MKAIADTIKDRRPKREKPRPSCGTLNYMAECRGTVKQTEPVRSRPRPGIMSQTARSLPAVV